MKRRDVLKLLEAADAPRDGGAASGPPEVAQEHERRRLVHEALGTLDEAQRRALEMAFFDGLSHRDIAERTDQPPMGWPDAALAGLGAPALTFSDLQRRWAA